MTFESLELAPALLKAVQDLGFEHPTPIQQEAIPVVLSGVDLMAGAQTGTGKTGGFALPILHRLSQEPPAKNQRKRVIPRALILAPTRELAAQIEESFRQFSKYLKLSISVVYGGVSMNPQIQRFQRGVDIVIATPGRLLDLHQQGFVDLSQIQTLVLDEADRMLDMGFIIDIRKILEFLPQERQSLLFSATFSEEIRTLAAQILNEPHIIEVTPSNTTVDLIEQIAHPVARAKKLELLIKLIQEHQWYQVLIFTRTKFGANKVSEVLEKNGINSAALHGNKSQAARTAALRDFKAGRIQAMVATDIAARGIDIDHLACVVNYELPNVSEDYVHRIGRTGRAGSEGVAISLVTVDEAGFMQQIEKFIHRDVEQVVIEGFAPPSSEKGMPIVMGRQVLWGGLGKAPSRRASASHVKAERQQLSQQPRTNTPRTRKAAGDSSSREGTARRGPGGREQRSEYRSEGRFDRRSEGARDGFKRDERSDRPNSSESRFERRRPEGRSENRFENRSEGSARFENRAERRKDLTSESRFSRPRSSAPYEGNDAPRRGAGRFDREERRSYAGDSSEKENRGRRTPSSSWANPNPPNRKPARTGSKSGFKVEGSARPQRSGSRSSSSDRSTTPSNRSGASGRQRRPAYA